MLQITVIFNHNDRFFLRFFIKNPPKIQENPVVSVKIHDNVEFIVSNVVRVLRFIFVAVHEFKSQLFHYTLIYR